VKFIVIEVDVEVTEVMAGANGVVYGVVAEPAELAPAPAALIARIVGV
jgi:hypothetical protein